MEEKVMVEVKRRQQMDEDKYQLGIRKLDSNDLVNLVIGYRNKLIGCKRLCEDFAQHNLAQDPLHKVICAEAAADLELRISDYNLVLKEVTAENE